MGAGTSERENPDVLTTDRLHLLSGKFVLFVPPGGIEVLISIDPVELRSMGNAQDINGDGADGLTGVNLT